jgi:glutaredoxin
VLNPQLYLFVKSGNMECENAKKLVEASGIPFEIIDVEKKNIMCSMWFDFGSTKVPILATRELVVSGFNYIKPYVQKMGRV